MSAKRARSPRQEPSVDFMIAQMFRRECSTCGSRLLTWFVGAEAADHLGTAAAAEMLDAMPRSEARRAACWKCVRCGDAGAFGGIEFG